MELYFDKPAHEWEETLPIGNGFLGGMIHGGLKKEIIGLNDEALWSGYPREKRNPQAHCALDEVRALILAGKNHEAERIIANNMLGEYNESYLPIGNLIIETEDSTTTEASYKRSLSLDQAVVTVDNGNCHREYFASYPEKALFGKWTKTDSLFSVGLSFDCDWLSESFTENDCLFLSIQAPEHMEPNYVDLPDAIVQGTRGGHFEYSLEIIASDGEVIAHENQLEIKDAHEFSFIFHRKADQVSKDFETAKKAHIKDYKRLFDTVELDLGPTIDLPIDKRMAHMKEGKEDPALVALYFQYSRYLLISSSRKGSLPANLQGIWSWQRRAPWSSNWTTNINAEMNYWGADIAGLSECFEPYSQFVEKVIACGQQTAQDYYGARGSCCHHNVDKWLSTNPVGYPKGTKKASDGAVSWAMWPLAAVWMTADLYRHYEYINDLDYLREVVYPNLRQATLFLTDYLVEVDELYHSIPSSSPENKFYDTAGNIVSVDKSVTMDLCLIKENFHFFVEICQKLKIKDELLEKVCHISNHLPTIKIGSHGQILEWQEEYPEVEPGHRHVSHLYGLYPGELYGEGYQTAAKKSLELRIESGSGHTGWSNAWLINLFAVLGDGKMAYEHLLTGITKASYPNLWSKHPPFQIDGNFGAIAGIANLFVQDRNGQVKLLPTLPKAFANGHVKGLRIKGHKSVEITWEKGAVVEATITELNV